MAALALHPPRTAGEGSIPPRREDPGLVEKLRTRDPEAVRRVVEATLPQLHRAARGAGLSQSEAAAAVQSTFATFLEKVPDFEGRSQVRTFLFGILYRKLAEAGRRAARERAHDPIDEVMEARFDASGHWARPPAAVDSVVLAAEIRKHIADCLESLPMTQRMAFELREVEDLSTPEIRNVLGVTSTNLRVLLFRGRNRLRECLEQKGVRGSRDAEL